MNILLSVFPILLLFVLMLGVKMAGHKSAFFTLVATLLIAWLAAPILGFTPENYTQDGVLWAFVEGLLKATFPILIIILMAIYSYNTLLESGEIEIIKKQFTSLTNDRGIIVLLLVWGFARPGTPSTPIPAPPHCTTSARSLRARIRTTSTPERRRTHHG